jgi:hypothetical protein
VSERSDRWRSLLRSAALAAGRGAARAWPVARVREIVREWGGSTVRVSVDALREHLGRAPDVQSYAVSIGPDGARIEASFAGGEELAVRLVPVSAFFAPGGAKELVLHAEPSSALQSRHLSDVVLCVADAVAHALWAPVMRRDPRLTPSGVVDRGEDGLRVDLRSLPSVRAIRGGRIGQTFTDALRPTTFRAEQDALVLSLAMGLPTR